MTVDGKRRYEVVAHGGPTGTDYRYSIGSFRWRRIAAVVAGFERWMMGDEETVKVVDTRS